MEKICVAVRVRPPVSQEICNGTFWNVEDNRVSLHKQPGTPISGLSFTFDHVFDENCETAQIYKLLTKDIIHAAVQGFNGTVFAYGQTSSGKTFTMNGSSSEPGIIPLSVRDVFDNIQNSCDREFLIRVSYMEIYNEEINDLLAVENQKLQIHESLERGIFVAGLREEIVNSAEQVLKLIQSGEVNRHFGETNMNARSSRSHTIFRMVIESKGKEANTSGEYTSSDAIRVSVLNLVDLAGSERIAKTGADGVRLKEGKHINKSLMALGNVINKLSDGAKQRGHIPYRDSKLTRILQPALGGNAKTSVICTIAPEEVHIEETKGTLQFASRAKRITNCAQVNEILTDAALLKRQKLEIEELQRKLQGSRAEVLEQEILKLRNDMLKYELEREKLEMELEEERRSRKERDECIREQELKTQNHINYSISDSAKTASQELVSRRRVFEEECEDSNSVSKADVFVTPSFKAARNSFVVKRSNYSSLPDCSPLPDAFSNLADEDTWFKMNKGYVADLDSLQITPARKVQSFPSNDATPGCSNDNYREEVQKLKRQLEIIRAEKNDLQRKYTEEVSLNGKLNGEISELTQVMREIPQTLCKSVANCKQLYEDFLFTLQSLAPGGNSSTAKLLSSTSEIGSSLFSSLETHFSMATDSTQSLTRNAFLFQKHCKDLCEKMKNNITNSALSETADFDNNQTKNSLCRCSNKGCSLGEEKTNWEEKLRDEVSSIQEKYQGLEKEFNLNNKLLEDCKVKYSSLEREFQVLKEERDCLVEEVGESSKKLVVVTEQKENVLRDLNSEVKRRKDIEEEINKISVAFASRQKSLVSFHNELKSKVEILRAQDPVSLPKSLGGVN